jgi:integrase
MKITQANLSKIVPAPGKYEAREFDTDLVGFGVRAWGDPKKLKRAWIIQWRRLNGKTQTLTLGRCDRMSASVARELAKEKLAQAELAKRGRAVDPGKEHQAARQHASETFETFADRFLETKESLRSVDQLRLHLTEHWSPFARRSIHAITRRDIAARLGEIAKERGKYAANRARSTLSSFYSWMMKEGLLDELDSNPVSATNKYADEKARERVLSDAELAGIWNACGADDFGNIVRLLILFGQRRQEVAGMQRAELDLPGRKWTIPSERTKNGRVHEIPLSDPALEILEQVIGREGHEDRAAIFGDGIAGAGFSGFSKAKAGLEARIEQKTGSAPAEWRLHDLRRTVASGMARLGIGLPAIEKVLNHTSGSFAGIVGVYQRHDFAAEKRQALDMWGAHVVAIATGKRASKVTALRRGA